MASGVERARKAAIALAAGAFVLVLGGCERGCLSRWLAKRGVATGGRPETPSSGQTPATDRTGVSLAAVDCPDGLARCGAGIVQVSRAYAYPEPCTGSPEQCSCPWERLGDCPSGCAAEGLEIDAPRERALAQLCAPLPGTAPFAVPPGGDAIVFACDQAFACDHGLVVACGPPAHAVGMCLKGCARDGQSADMDDESAPLTPGAALAVLCAR